MSEKPTNFDTFEEHIEDKDKAHKMALSEDEYQELAKNARQENLEDLAIEWGRKGEEKAGEAGKEWEEEKRQVEKRIERDILNTINDVISNRERGSHKSVDLSNEEDFLAKLEKVLDVKEVEGKHKKYNLTLGTKVEIYETVLNKILYEKNIDHENEKVRKASLRLAREGETERKES